MGSLETLLPVHKRYRQCLKTNANGNTNWAREHTIHQKHFKTTNNRKNETKIRTQTRGYSKPGDPAIRTTIIMRPHSFGSPARTARTIRTKQKRRRNEASLLVMGGGEAVLTPLNLRLKPLTQKRKLSEKKICSAALLYNAIESHGDGIILCTRPATAIAFRSCLSRVPGQNRCEFVPKASLSKPQLRKIKKIWMFIDSCFLQSLIAGMGFSMLQKYPAKSHRPLLNRIDLTR